MPLPALKDYLEFDSKRLIVGFREEIRELSSDRQRETVFLCVDMNVEMFYQ